MPPVAGVVAAVATVASTAATVVGALDARKQASEQKKNQTRQLQLQEQNQALQQRRESTRLRREARRARAASLNSAGSSGAITGSIVGDSGLALDSALDREITFLNQTGSLASSADAITQKQINDQASAARTSALTTGVVGLTKIAAQEATNPTITSLANSTGE